jgi:hypothetical protein
VNGPHGEIVIAGDDLKVRTAALAENAGLRASEVREELERIVASTNFRDSLRLTSFLRFVVEAALTGKNRQIKAYTVAVEALGRSADFDPQTNAIVRVEAGRLRQALARYYADGGCNDRLFIGLPVGTYVPTFQWRDTVGDPVRIPARERDEKATQSALSDIVLRCQQLGFSFAAAQQLLEIHRLELMAALTEVDSALQTLGRSRAY